MSQAPSSARCSERVRNNSLTTISATCASPLNHDWICILIGQMLFNPLFCMFNIPPPCINLGDDIPEWFAFKSVVKVLREQVQKESDWVICMYRERKTLLEIRTGIVTNKVLVDWVSTMSRFHACSFEYTRQIYIDVNYGRNDKGSLQPFYNLQFYNYTNLT